MRSGTVSTVTREAARRLLVAHLGLGAPLGVGDAGIVDTLARLRCIQLDPLDPMGTNADLVVLARVDGALRGNVHRALRGHAFEHFAKERCLVPRERFAEYLTLTAATPWWRSGLRESRVPESVVTAVADALREHGPCTADELPDFGAVEPLDWSGWKGTARATAMALEILWLRCQAVVVGRDPAGRKLWEPGARAFAEARAGESEDAAWARLLEDRVQAAGLLAHAGGAHWSMLAPVRGRAAGLLAHLGGQYDEVRVEGATRTYFVRVGAFDAPPPEPDDRLRILGPLDPLLWDRKLVNDVFEFEYVWEVYKPPATRRWGWYVCPLLHRGALVGRLEGRVVREAEPRLEITTVWEERKGSVDRRALRRALQRHATACGAGAFSIGEWRSPAGKRAAPRPA